MELPTDGVFNDRLSLGRIRMHGIQRHRCLEGSRVCQPEITCIFHYRNVRARNEFSQDLDPSTRSEGRGLTDDRLLVGSFRFIGALGRHRPSTTHDDQWDTVYR
jgi:hypothetical protein